MSGGFCSGKLELIRSADDNPAESLQYIGYARKYKRWNIEYPNGLVIFLKINVLSKNTRSCVNSGYRRGA